MIKVSVILPSLNVADYIEECISSAMNQTLQDIEVISVDAGSTDGTVEILKKCSQEDSRIKLLTSDIKSYGKQVNMGFEAASGKYIAILETDDYVDLRMYEDLYNIGEEHNLDFVLADFDRFYEVENGIKKAVTVSTWKDKPEVYGGILTSIDLSKSHNPNPNLWRGIYLKDFLVNNQIRLNETPGAAYQDICYMHRVMMHAERAMFVPESYYRYRVDRDGSSVNSVKGLQYSYQEYKVLFEKNEIVRGFESKVYYMMAHSFIGEITQIYPRMDEFWKENNLIYYTWFRERLLYSIEQGFINEELLGGYMWKRLKLLLESFESYLFTLKYPGNTASLVQKASKDGTIIFGAGKRGRYLYDKIHDNILLEAFCDNSESLWNTEIRGLRVLSVEKCIMKYPDNNYIIAVKDCSDVIKNQLIEGGISDNKIFTYISDVE